MNAAIALWYSPKNMEEFSVVYRIEKVSHVTEKIKAESVVEALVSARKTAKLVSENDGSGSIWTVIEVKSL